MSGDQEPHTNGLNGDASDEEVSSEWDQQSSEPQNIALETDILSSCLLQMWN